MKGLGSAIGRRGIRTGLLRRSTFLVVASWIAFSVALPTASARPTSSVKLVCRGPAGFSASVTWTWTYHDRVFRDRHYSYSVSQTCSGDETTTGDPYRPGLAFRFSITITLTDGRLTSVVGPSHGFHWRAPDALHYTELLTLASHETLLVHMTA